MPYARRIFIALFIGSGWPIWSAADKPGPCPSAADLFGSSDVTALSGNGGLTVGVNPFGRVSLCKWPSPGYSNQVRYRTRAVELVDGSTGGGAGPTPLTGDGLMWGVRVGGRTLWLRGGPWKTRQEYARVDSAAIRTYAECTAPPLAVMQEIFVHAAQDLLASRIEVRGAKEAPALYWYANFSPCTRVLPEIPLTDWLCDTLNDFAVFTPDEGKTLHHFRPRNPGARQWAAAEDFAAAPSNAAEFAFEDGVWIAAASPNDVAGFQCGLDNAASSALAQAEAGSLDGQPAAAGQCHSIMELAPQREADVYTASVFIAFAENKTQAEEILRDALAQGYDALREETEAHWKTRLASARLPSAAGSEVLASCRRDLLTLIQCMDRDTGAIVRSPVVQPPYALDWPWAGAWITLALDTAGYHDLAGAHALFYTTVSRNEGKPGKPYGSLPAAAYANGAEGLPHLVLDTEATAWALASYWRHAGYLEEPRQLNFLSKTWDAARRGGDFLVNWVDSRNREPLHSFDVEAWCDRRSTRLLLTHFMGIDSAIKIAEALAQELPPAWSRYKTDLEIRIRLRIAEGQLAPLSATRSNTAGEILAAKAITQKSLPGYYNDRLPPLGAPPPFPDALHAALHFIAAAEIYAQPR